MNILKNNNYKIKYNKINNYNKLIINLNYKYKIFNMNKIML